MQHITEPQLLEFYYCGMRTGYSYREIKGTIPERKTEIYNCEYCPNYHVVPQVDNVKETAINEYSTFINELTQTKPINLSVKHDYEPSPLTDAIIIRSID
jgi:hypothetical protein